MIKYLLYNGADINIRNSSGVSCRDLLVESELMYLAENIDDGYESSLAKSSISQNSKKSESSGRDTFHSNR